MTEEHLTPLQMEAIAYAFDLLEGFQETSGTPRIAVWLDDLADEYDRARRDNRGMDPHIVRCAVQALISVQKFPVNNSPEEHSAEQGLSRNPFVSNLFFYARPKSGRPNADDRSARTVFTVTAVAARFDVDIYQNDPGYSRTTQPPVNSAIMIVAKAYSRLAQKEPDRSSVPSSYSGVRDSYERGLKSTDVRLDGELYGTQDKQFAIKMATTERH